MDDRLRQAIAALREAAEDVPHLSDAATIRARLRLAADEILTNLEAETETEPEDVFSRLRHQSQDIAEDLRRADRLMKERTQRE